jgi:diacylglycerol kinase (ATP)
MHENSDTFSFSGRVRSTLHAGQGILAMLKSQHNAWVHAFATVCVVIAGIVFDVSAMEWCLLILAMVGVWVAEGLNTAFEFLCDVASPEFHPLVKQSKDVAAGAVLLSAIGAAAIGLIVLGPYLLQCF